MNFFKSVEQHPHDKDMVVITVTSGQKIHISKREAKRLSFLLDAAVKGA